MTSPESSGHFHFSQDINVALSEIEEAIRGFPPKIQGALSQLQESLALSVAVDPTGAEEFLNEIHTVLARAQESVRAGIPQISEALQRGFAVDFTKLEAEAVREVERIANILQRGLGRGLIAPELGGQLQGVLTGAGQTLRDTGVQAAGAAGITAPEFAGLNVRIEELTAQLSLAVEDVRLAEQAERRLASAAEANAAALDRAGEIQTQAARDVAAAGKDDVEAKRRAQQALTAVQAEVTAAAKELAAATQGEARASEARRELAGILAGPPPAPLGRITPQSLVDEFTPRAPSAEEPQGNLLFRNRRPAPSGGELGPLTVPLGGGLTGRFDDQGANPRIFQTIPARDDKFLGRVPAESREITREEDPTKFAALTQRLDIARGKLADTYGTINEVERNLIKASELLALKEQGLATRLGDSAQIRNNQTGEGFRLVDNKRADGRSEAIPLGEQQSFKLDADLAKQNEKLASARTQQIEAAQNEAKAAQELALGERLANERRLGVARNLGNSNFALSDGSFVKREGESARRITAGNELADAEESLGRQTRRLGQVQEKRIQEERTTSKGVLQGFVGGFTSRGFDSNGDPSQTLSKDITNLSATAGVLAKYSLAGAGISIASTALRDLREGTIQYTEQIEHLNLFLEHLNEELGSTNRATIDLSQAQGSATSVGLDLNSAIEVGIQSIAAYQEEIRNGASANEIFNESIKQTGVAVLLSGQKAEVAARQLRAITFSFDTGSQGQAQANDAITNARKNFGGDQAQIAQAVAGAAPLASQGGISQETLANIASLINARTSQSGAQIATTIERLVSRSQNKQFISALQSQGIENTGNVTQELTKLSEAYKKLDKPSQVALENQLGSSRALTGIIPVLRSFNEVNDATAKSLDGQGLSQIEANKHLQSFGGQLEVLGAVLKTLAVDVGKSGIFAPLGLAIELVSPPLRLATDLLGGFEKAFGPIGTNILGFVVDIALVSKAVSILAAGKLRAAAASGVEAAADQALAKSALAAAAAAGIQAESDAAATALKAAKTAATEALAVATAALVSEEELLRVTETQAALVAEAAALAQKKLALTFQATALAAREATLAVGAAAGAEEKAAAAAVVSGQARGLRGLLAGRFGRGAAAAEEGAAGAGAATGLGVGAIAGIAVAGIAVVALGQKARELGGALGEAGSSVDKITHGNLNDLNASIERLATARANVDAKASGLLGSTVNFLGGDPASGSRRELDAQIAELKAQRDELAALATTPAGKGSTAVFGPDGPKTVIELTDGIKLLKDSGAGASTIMKTLSSVIDNLTGASTRAANKIAPGSLVLPSGSAGLEQTLLASLKDVKLGPAPNINALDPAALRALTSQGVRLGSNAPDAATGPFGGLGQPKPAESSALTGITPSAEQSKAFREAVNATLVSLGKTSANSVLTPQDQAAVADAGARALNLHGILADLAPLLSKQLLDKLKDDAAKPLTKERIAADPALLDAEIGGLVAAGAGRVSDARARGAGSAELLKINSENITALQNKIDEIKAGGTDVKSFDNLTQAPAVAKKELVDAYIAQIHALLEVALRALPANDTKGRQALENQAARIEALANTAPVSELSRGVSSIGNAETDLTNSIAAQAKALVATAEATLKAAQQDAAALNALAANLQAEASAALAAADKNPASSGRDEIRALKLDSQATRLRAQGASETTGARQGVTDAVNFRPAHNDPSLDPGIANLLARSNQPANIPKTRTSANGPTAAETAAQIEALRLLANVFPGDKIGEASAKLQGAAAELDAASGSRAADQRRYYTALRSLHEAQQAYALAILQQQSDDRLLGIDRTNPLLVAQEKVRAAQARLNSDNRRGAPGNLLNADKIALGDAQSQAEATAFGQRLSDAQTNDQLGRISHEAYLRYLQHEHDRLTAIRVRTFQQNQELNQIDSALQSATASLQGQFNLANIKLPSIFQARTAVAGGSNVGNTQNVSIVVNGGDINQVKQVLSQFLGSGAFQRTSFSTAKV